MAEHRSGQPGRTRAVALLLVLLAAAPASALTYGDIEVVPIGEPRGYAVHGYIDYRLLVRHKGTQGARRVALVVPGDAHGIGRGSVAGVTRRIVIEPGKTQQVSLLVPVRPEMYGQGVGVWIDGRKEENRVPLTLVSGRGHYRGGFGGGSDMIVYYSQRVPENFFAPVGAGAGMGGGMIHHGGGGGAIPPGGGVIAPAPPPGAGLGKKPPPKVPPKAPPKAPPGGGPPEPADEEPEGEPGAGGAPVPIMYMSGQQVRADTPASNWGRHWLSYSRYDGIVVTSEDLIELANGGNETLAVLQALRQYAETGGALIVLGPGKVEVPASWQRQKTSEHGCTIYACGFGRCVVTPDRESARWTVDRWALLQTAWSGTGQPFQSSRSMLDLNTTLPVIDDLGVPVRGLFLLMILFTAAVGPLNLYLLTRWKRRIWMLWTVPVASFFTCLAVFGYMIVAEGWQGHANVRGLTILDESEKRATSIGRAGFYSPLTPGDGLHFSGDTEVMPQGNEHSAFSNRCTIDWSEDQHLSRGWVSARVPAHFQMRKSEPSRLRVAVQREGNTLVITNMLGADIKSITLADEKGKLHHAEDVPAGEKAPLKPIKGELKREANAFRSQLYTAGDWATVTKNSPGKAETILLPRSYLAVVAGSPFLEQGLAGARVRDSESVVIGLMAD